MATTATTAIRPTSSAYSTMEAPRSDRVRAATEPPTALTATRAFMNIETICVSPPRPSLTTRRRRSHYSIEYPTTRSIGLFDPMNGEAGARRLQACALATAHGHACEVTTRRCDGLNISGVLTRSAVCAFVRTRDVRSESYASERDGGLDQSMPIQPTGHPLGEGGIFPQGNIVKSTPTERSLSPRLTLSYPASSPLQFHFGVRVREKLHGQN